MMMKKMKSKRRKAMKMNTKKTISAALALILSAAVLTTGCGKAEETNELGLSDVSYVEETTISAEETFISGDLTRAELEAKNNWNETQIKEVMYTTQACYSRSVPEAGAKTVSKYKKGTKVNVVAATDTGYYKLEDGSFIHSSFLSDTKPGAVTTTAEDVEEIFDDEDTTTKKTTTKKTTSKTTTKKTTTKKTTTESTQKPTASTGSVTYNIDYTTKYAYKQLSASEQTLYANLVYAAKNFITNVPVPTDLSDDQVVKVYVIVINQEPELFWLPRSVPGRMRNTMRVNYVYDAEQAAEIQKELDKNVKTILNTVNQYKSTFSKIKVIYDWVIKNSIFSLSDTEDTISIKNGLTKGAEVQCAGYAKTMQYLFDLAGIESMVIVGKNAEGSTHAWNKVYCDNGYYNIDATWGDLNNHGDDYIRYNYFLVPDSWITIDHLHPNTFFRGNGTAIKLFDEPSCTKTSANYYKVYKKEFEGYKNAMAGMKAEIDAAIKSKTVAVTIRVTDESTWNKMNTDTAFRELQNYAKSKSAKVKKLSRLKKYGQGTYVVQYDITYN